MLHVEGTATSVVSYTRNLQSSGFVGSYWGTDQTNVGVIFKNGTTRSDDGGVNTMTIRNDGGDLRLQNNSTASATLSGGLTTITGDIRKSGSTAGNYSTWFGGNSTNSPYHEYFVNGLRRMYVGFANTNDTYIIAEEGAQLNLGTQGATRLTINTTGDVNITNALTLPNQPFCIIGGVAGTSVAYSAPMLIGSENRLFAYTSAGLNNATLSGWSSQAGQFWFTRTGRWQVNWQFYWNSFTAGSRVVINIRKPFGAPEQRYCAVNASGFSGDTMQSYSSIFYVNSGDYMETTFENGSGTLFFGGIKHTHLTVQFLG
jgi:hypothetical protein